MNLYSMPTTAETVTVEAETNSGSNRSTAAPTFPAVSPEKIAVNATVQAAFQIQ